MSPIELTFRPFNVGQEFSDKKLYMNDDVSIQNVTQSQGNLINEEHIAKEKKISDLVGNMNNTPLNNIQQIDLIKNQSFIRLQTQEKKNLNINVGPKDPYNPSDLPLCSISTLLEKRLTKFDWSTNTIRFGTFNVGQGYSDYSGMIGGLATIGGNTDVQNYNTLGETIRTAVDGGKSLFEAKDEIVEPIECSVAKRLAEKCDVIALQEVMRLERPFIKTLKEQGFEVFRFEDTEIFSTAVAIRKEMFDIDSTENKSIKSESSKEKRAYGQEIAAVMTKIKNLNIEIAFSSMHSWGFQLYNPESKQSNKYNQRDKDNIQSGVIYTQETLENLKEKNFSVIGGDMNNNPENQPGQFDVIKSHGFDSLTPKEATNINGNDIDYPHRTIDFIHVSTPSLWKKVWDFVSSFFTAKTYLTYSPAEVLEGFDFQLFDSKHDIGSCSDHKPVVTTLTITHVPSTISRIFSAIFGRSTQ